MKRLLVCAANRNVSYKTNWGKKPTNMARTSFQYTKRSRTLIPRNLKHRCSTDRAVAGIAIFVVAWLLLLGGVYVKFHSSLEDHAGHANTAGLPMNADTVHMVSARSAAAAAAAAAELARQDSEGLMPKVLPPHHAQVLANRASDAADAAQALADAFVKKVKGSKKDPKNPPKKYAGDDAAEEELPPRSKKLGRSARVHKKPQFERLDDAEHNFMKKQVELLKLKEEVDPHAGSKVGGKKGFGNGFNDYKVRDMHHAMLRAGPVKGQEVVDERLREDPDLPDLPLPEFWMPKVGQDLDSIGTREGGDETIYVAISSYRDALCTDTIAGMFKRAEKPNRIFVGVVEQNKPDDPTCLPLACEDSTADWTEAGAGLTEDEKVVCSRRQQIRIFHLRAYDSLGPTYARHIGHRMYRGEYFTLQVDAHITFVNGWDAKLITQWKSTGNERAVLSAYPEDTRGATDKNGDAVRHTTSIMCNFFFEFSSVVGLLQHHGASRISPAKIQGISRNGQVSPVLHPFWAAGMSFARGHFVVRVPYDPHTPMLFQGEEILMAVKAWTSGYDFYACAESVLFHPYNRKNKPVMFWENEGRHHGTRPRSARRVRTVMGCDDPPDLAANLYELEEYNLGYERPIEWFNYLFGVDCKHNKMTFPVCKEVTSGDMHREFTKYLPLNRLGIDYSKVPLIIDLEKRRDADGKFVDSLVRERGIGEEVEDPEYSASEPSILGGINLVADFDGPDHDPDLPKLALPEFWKPQEDNTNIDGIGSFVDDVPTIYVSIASYRDGLCFDTIANLFERTKYPDRLSIGAVEQNTEGDPTCVPAACEMYTDGEEDDDKPMPDDPRERLVCSRRNQIRLFKLDAKESLGPTFARHIGSRLYRGEYYSLQIDAHITFVNDWDELLIAQWQLLNNERAVLSTYLKDTTGATNEAGDSVVTTTPIMCDFTFSVGKFPIVQYKVAYDINAKKVALQLAADGLPRTQSADGKTTTPLLQALWAAGMAFSRGHFTYRVPYDPHFAMMFQGEEALIALRGWTHGYDVYAPSQSVMFHPYRRKDKPKGMFWENNGRHEGAADRAAQRWRAMMWCDDDPLRSANLRERTRYGLGEERPVVWYYHLFGMDCVNKKRTRDICPESWKGGLHRKYNQHLRSNRMGIDYFQVPEIQAFDRKHLVDGRYDREAFSDSEDLV